MTYFACKLMQARTYMTYVTHYRVNISKPYNGFDDFTLSIENTRISHAMLAYRKVSTQAQFSDQHLFSTRPTESSCSRSQFCIELVLLKDVETVTRTADFYMIYLCFLHFI